MQLLKGVLISTQPYSQSLPMDLSLATPELKPQWFEIQTLTSSSMEVRDEGYSLSKNT